MGKCSCSRWRTYIRIPRHRMLYARIATRYFRRNFGIPTSLAWVKCGTRSAPHRERPDDSDSLWGEHSMPLCTVLCVQKPLTALSDSGSTDDGHLHLAQRTLLPPDTPYRVRRHDPGIWNCNQIRFTRLRRNVVFIQHDISVVMFISRSRRGQFYNGFHVETSSHRETDR